MLLELQLVVQDDAQNLDSSLRLDRLLLHYELII